MTPSERKPRRARRAAVAVAVGCAALAAGLAGCGSGSHTTPAPSTAAQVVTGVSTLPGVGRPPVTIGDKNFTEQFVLGELYLLALQAQGYNVSLNRNIGPTEVSYQAVASGRLSMYPEYLSIWNAAIAGVQHPPQDAAEAFITAQSFAHEHGMVLLTPTPFSDNQALAVTRAYARANDLHTVQDLRRVATELTLGAPPEFQQSPTGLPQVEQVYGFTPAAVKSLDIGAQYAALDKGVVQAAYVTTTDAQLSGHQYLLLKDPKQVFGVGNVVPVVSAQVQVAEGPAFTSTIDSVSALLTQRVIRQLNADVDISGEDPAAVAKQFLEEHGLLPASPS